MCGSPAGILEAGQPGMSAKNHCGSGKETLVRTEVEWWKPAGRDPCAFPFPRSRLDSGDDRGRKISGVGRLARHYEDNSRSARQAALNSS